MYARSSPTQGRARSLYIPETEVKEDERVVRFEQEIEEKIAAIPGVESVAMCTKIAMDLGGWHDPIFVEGRTYAEGELPSLRNGRFCGSRKRWTEEAIRSCGAFKLRAQETVTLSRLAVVSACGD